MQRFLGIDIGTKRIGIAICDPMLITTRSLIALPRVPEDKAVEEIAKICKEYSITTVAVGLPYNMDGTLGSQAQDCQNFAKRLEVEAKLEVCFEDERLTSFEAEQILASQGKKYTKNKELVDMMSAEIILRQFINKRSK
jgi:putative Holliday junction resolvase